MDPDLSRIKGPNLALRLIQPEDAAYVHGLRIDPAFIGTCPRLMAASRISAAGSRVAKRVKPGAPNSIASFGPHGPTGQSRLTCAPPDWLRRPRRNASLLPAATG